MQISTSSSKLASTVGVEAMPGSEPNVSMKPAARPNNTVPAMIFFESRAVSSRCSFVAKRSPKDKEPPWDVPSLAAARVGSSPRSAKALPSGSSLRANAAWGAAIATASRQTPAATAADKNTCGTESPTGRRPSARPHAANMKPAGRPTSKLSSTMPWSPPSGDGGHERAQHQQPGVAPHERPRQQRIARTRRSHPQQRERDQHARERAP